MKKIVKVCIFIIGLIMCAYPLVSNLIVQRYQKDTVATHEKMVAQMEDSHLEDEYERAKEYNHMLFQAKSSTIADLNFDSQYQKKYESLLNISDNGIMGSIEIPKISLNLPIYHGTSEDVLAFGVGHVEDSSLPIGGVNTRAVLTGHRGLPNAKLFTRLDEIETGDLFFVTVLDEILAYKVCDIDVITPEDIQTLEIQEGKDLITLITCTPYGINTHRLLVTGERVANETQAYEAIETKLASTRELAFTCLPFLFLGIGIVQVSMKMYKRRKSKKGGNHEGEKV